MSFIPKNIHKSWIDFLTADVIRMLENIERAVGESYNPSKEKVLRFLTTDLDAMKVVILGQDPYPEKGVATGRAFEVGTLKTWDQPFRQVSLKNFIRLIYKETHGISEYDKIPAFSQISSEIKAGSFKIDVPPILFENLEKQGVLFLNTCFTVIPGQPLSHSELWEPFTAVLIPYISSRNQTLNWFLWGKSAAKYKSLIFKGKFYESRHPMMCSKVYSDDFLKSGCIKETLKTVNWTGR